MSSLLKLTFGSGGGFAGDGHVHDAARFVHGHRETPDIRARTSLPPVAPRVVAELAFARDRVKIPEFVAAHRVVRPRIAGRTDGHFVDARADHHDVSVD